MKNRIVDLSQQLQAFDAEIQRLEGRILELEQSLHSMVDVQRNHLIRIKNHEVVPDEFILYGRKYQDLSPERAWKHYCDKNFDFILIDVSSKNYVPAKKLPESIHIPWEDLADRFMEIQTRTTPIFVISEDGTKSILACEFLVKRGFYNCNNISGGYKYWLGLKLEEVKNQSA